MNKSLVETAINPINNHGELAVEISNVPKASGYIMLYSEVPALADFKEQPFSLQEVDASSTL